MKNIKKPVFFIVLCLVAAFSYLALAGVHTQYGDVTKTWVRGISDVRWGIDIRGGVDVTFAPPEGYDASDTEMEAAKSIIETRLVNENITDYELYVDNAKDQIIVRFPWQADDEEFDPESAVKELGETALLTFREGGTSSIPSGGTYEDLPLVLSGSQVDYAQAQYNSQEKKYIVELVLKEEGKEAFSAATEKLLPTNGAISIWMDDQLISQPSVSAHITDGRAEISGNFTAETVTELANKINGGALPFKLRTESFSTITPTLGTGARDAMGIAGVISLAFIVIFMIIVYRIPGVIASINLIGQVAGMFAAITGFFPVGESFTLTIPGIAGMILSVGMGVDANVITAERIKEELRAGKSLDSAVRIGYKRAFSAIFDGNITMVLVAMVLMGAFGTSDSICYTIFYPVFCWFGVSTEGTIFSFGYTLIAGIVTNFIFGVFTSRLMTASLSKFKAFRKPALYGGVKSEN